MNKRQRIRARKQLVEQRKRGLDSGEAIRRASMPIQLITLTLEEFYVLLRDYAAQAFPNSTLPSVDSLRGIPDLYVDIAGTDGILRRYQPSLVTVVLGTNEAGTQLFPHLVTVVVETNEPGTDIDMPSPIQNSNLPINTMEQLEL